jgi:hypothetical protein
MAVKRSAILALGGEDAFAAHQAEFDRLFRSGPVVDVLRNTVRFPPNACRHVCFKPPEEDPYSQLPREVWSQERAERIPWILTALTAPGVEVRPNVQRPDRLSYILVVEAVPEQGLPQEYYGVVTEPVGPGEVEFVTAFPFDHAYWARWRTGGAPLYPRKAPRPKKKARR